MILQKDSSSNRKQLNALVSDLQKDVSVNFDTRTILFGSSAMTKENNAPDFKEKETDIDALLYEIENNYSNENIGALILLSDGIYNKGGNPLNRAGQIPFPVYTIAAGDTTELKDIAVQRISNNDFAYLGNIFPVQVSISGKKFSGKEISASLYEGKTKKGEQNVKINSDNFFTTLTFTLSAEIGGMHRYSINLTNFHDETNTNNNSRSFVIEVIDQRSKILLIASAPHPDITAIKESLQNNSAFETVIQIGTEKQPALKAFSLVILHGYSSSQSKIISECVSNNIPYWLVNPTATDNLPGVKITASNNRFNDAEPVPAENFGLFNLSADVLKMIREFPAVKTFFGNYTLNPGANNLITQKIGAVETENPILFFNESNNQKNAVFLGDGLWKWKLRNYSEKKNTEAFNELINKTALYLSVKSDKSFFRVAAPKTVNENEQIDFSAEVYNKSYELISEPDVTLILTDNEKKQFNYTFSKTTNAYKLNLGFIPPGEYNWQAKVKNGNELLTKSGLLIVKEIVAESVNTVADHRLLFQLSERTGGKFYSLNQTKNLSDDLNKNELIKPITFTSNNTIPLIEYKWFFVLLIVLLSLEWLLRKRYTTI